jgi:hypothetical protein
MSGCSSFISTDRSGSVRQVLPETSQAQRPTPDSGIMPQGSGKGTSTLGELETLDRGVQVRPSPGCGAVRIGYDDRLAVLPGAGNDTQQLTLGGSFPTADAGAHGHAHTRTVRGIHRRPV